MNKELPCYIVSDLLPLYQEDILSEQTKMDMDKHLKECKDCQKKMDAMNRQIDIQPVKAEGESNPLKKVRFYQKMLTVLGAVIAFVLGGCLPMVRFGLAVLKHGEIAAYQMERFKNLWYVLALRSCVAGIILCAIYVLLLRFIRKIISKNG